MEPDTLGKYEVREPIGRGAVGTVHVAWDPVIQRQVAIKKLHRLGADYADAEKHTRFRQEARAAGRLIHPHIVSTFDYGETADCAYIVMELLPGPSLKEAIKQRTVSREDVGRIMTGILAGLRHSHDKGVVHRDIKPGNIVFAEDGEVKITDFGIARLENSDLTQTGSQIGTPAYMAPEQVLGEPADARSDLYSLGVVLFELLTFRRPFEGSTSSVLHHIVSSKPPPASQFAELVPPEMEAFLQKALAKDPADRFQTAAGFAEALREPIERWSQPAADAPPLAPPLAPPPPAPVTAPLATQEPRPESAGGFQAGQDETASTAVARPPSARRSKPLVLVAAAVLLLAGGAAVVRHRLAAGRGTPPESQEQVSDASPSAASPRLDAPQPPAAPAPRDPDASTAAPEPQKPEAPAAPSDGPAAGPPPQAADASPPAPVAEPAAGDAPPAAMAASPPPEPPGAAAALAIEGGIDGYSAEGWPVIDGRTVRLAGVAALPANAEKLVTGWTASHGSQLSCEPADPETYRCLTAQSLDLSQAILLNGLAKTVPGAAEAYRDAERKAQGAKRGLWK